MGIPSIVCGASSMKQDIFFLFAFVLLFVENFFTFLYPKCFHLCLCGNPKPCVWGAKHETKPEECLFSAHSNTNTNCTSASDKDLVTISIAFNRRWSFQTRRVPFLGPRTQTHKWAHCAHKLHISVWQWNLKCVQLQVCKSHLISPETCPIACNCCTVC